MKRDNRRKNSQKSLIGGGPSQSITPFKILYSISHKLTLDPNLVSSALHPFLEREKGKGKASGTRTKVRYPISDQTDAASIL